MYEIVRFEYIEACLFLQMPTRKVIKRKKTLNSEPSTCERFRKEGAMVLNRKLKMGMVGGGRDAFIGAVHRNAALMDGKVEFIAGALSSEPEKAKAVIKKAKIIKIIHVICFVSNIFSLSIIIF